MTEIKKKTVEDIEVEIKQAELELRKLEILDAKDRLAERQMKRDNTEQRARTSGQTLRQIDNQVRITQEHCNHKKGGTGAEGYVGGQGNDDQYAVYKHTFMSGDTWVSCLRCHKTWKPPFKKQFTIDGKLDQVAFKAAWDEYNRALAFQTLNSPSSSYLFKFTSTDPAVDAVDLVREQMGATTLR